jgi:hypothetical protein
MVIFGVGQPQMCSFIVPNKGGAGFNNEYLLRIQERADQDKGQWGRDCRATP